MQVFLSGFAKLVGWFWDLWKLQLPEGAKHFVNSDLFVKHHYYNVATIVNEPWPLSHNIYHRKKPADSTLEMVPKLMRTL